MKKALIVGTIGIDDVETPFGKAEAVLGGSAAYASAAASFFCRPSIISIIGKDLPKEHLQMLSKFRIDISGLTVGEKNFRWSGSYEYDMSQAETKKTELNSLLGFNPKLTEANRLSNVVFLANIDPELQLSVIKQLGKSRPFIILDTMNYWIENKRRELVSAIKKSDLVVINEGEARQLFETANLIIAGKQILELGPKYAVIKKGEHGALLFSLEGFFSAPGYPLESVIDPTGAGDTFAGGMAGYLAKSGKRDFTAIKKAVVYGSCLASFCAENFSLAYVKQINRNNIKERYNVFKEIRRF